MGENTKIQWCDHTFNPWVGCQKVSPGCANCYAEALMDKRLHFAQWGPNGSRVLTSDANWGKPSKWNRDAERDGVRPIVFCSSQADVFEDWHGPVINRNGDTCILRDPSGPDRPATLSDVREKLFNLIDAMPNLIWLLLTKRPGNIQGAWPSLPDGTRYRKNVWLYTSVENQEQAAIRINELCQCRSLSPVLGLSCEPLLEEIDLRPWLHNDMINHVIVGGESGADSRLFRGEWAEDLRLQCRHTNVPFFMKQFGSNPYYGIETGDLPKPLILSDRKGGNSDEWPDGFNVRQMPEKQEV